LPDVLISINLRTASGNEFGSARFADSPGYYFLLSSGKSIPLNTKAFTSLRFYGMLGFYAWQTNLAGHFQDDAVIYGFGIKLDSKHFSVSTDLDGFSGYLKNGDRPLVYRFRALTSMDSNINYGLQFEHGIVDYNFRSLRFSFIYSIESDK